MLPLVSRKLVTAIAVVGAVFPVVQAWAAVDFSYGGTPRWLSGMTQTTGAAYRNYNRIYGNTGDPKFVCYGPISPASTCHTNAITAANATFVAQTSSGSYGYGTAAAKCGDWVTLWVDCHTTQP